MGRWGLAVNVAALAYGVFALFLLARPAEVGDVLDRWIVLVGAALVLGVGLLYMAFARPFARSTGVPEGDAIEIADRLRALRARR